MPTNYEVQGADLGRFGAAPNLDSPVLGGEPTGSLGGSGAGLIESQEQARQFREQRERKMQQMQMAQELQQILANIGTPANTGLSAGMGNPAPFMGVGPDATGDIGGVNRSRAQQFFGGTLNNPAILQLKGHKGLRRLVVSWMVC